MNIKILGSGQDVGRSSIILEEGKRLMLDCGVKIEPPPPQYPKVEPVDGAVISHAHLDHVGATPLLAKKGKTQIFMNDLTLELGIMLIKDSIKVGQKEGYGTPYSEKDVKKMIKQTKVVTQQEKFKLGDLKLSLWHSGHIPGSNSVLVEGKKKVFYTSDIQTIDSHLLTKCRLPESVDTLIIESTYGLTDHPPRQQLEQDVVDFVEEVIANNESILFPVFAVGRAQEVMMILEKFADKIVVDGMARQASEIVEEYGSYLKDATAFRNVLERVHIIRKRQERDVILKKRPIIISSAGMLGGGPAVNYLRSISNRRGSKVLFTGFLVEDTPGKNLLNTNIFKNSEEEFDVHCEIKQFGLSAHTDRKGIYEIIRRTNPEQVICVHGEYCSDLARNIQKEFGIQAFAPKDGEIVRA